MISSGDKMDLEKYIDNRLENEQLSKEEFLGWL